MVKAREVVELGELTVDMEARRVSRNGEEVALGRLSFDLLQALIRAAPAALSADDIAQTVWSGDAVSDETITQRVSLLRRALEQEPGRDYVETLRGFGYRLGVEPRPSKMGGLVDPGRAGSSRLGRRVVLALIIVALLLLITVLATAVRQLKRAGIDPRGLHRVVESSWSGGWPSS